MGGIVGRLFREFAVTLSDRHRRLGAGVADADADDVRAAAASPTPERRTARALPRCPSGVFDGCSRGYERGARLGARPPRARCCWSTLAHGRAHGVPATSWCRRGSSRSRTPGCSCGFSEAAQDISFAGDARAAGAASTRSCCADPDVAHVVVVHRRARRHAGNTGTMFIALKPLQRAQGDAPTRSSRGCAPSWRDRGRERCSCSPMQDVRVGGRAIAHAVPVHAAGRRPRRAAHVGAAGARAAAQAARAAGRHHRPADRGAAARRRRSTATRPSRLGITPQAIDDTLYDAFGQRQVATILHRSSTSTAWCWR